jgi:hypothetical protein
MWILGMIYIFVLTYLWRLVRKMCRYKYVGHVLNADEIHVYYNYVDGWLP